MTQITANGNAYSDDGSAARDMRAGGHQTWLLPMLGDVMTQTAGDAADAASDAADAAASAAAAASSAANLVGTSTTSLAIGTGSKTWTTGTGRQWGVGQFLIAVDGANPANTMSGQITAYNSGTGSLTLDVTSTTGSGTIADWDIYVSGQRGATGATGATGASGSSMPRLALTGTTTIGATDNGKLIDCSGTFTATFDAPATLGANWQTTIRNSGTGDVTIAHTSGNIDGLSGFVLYPGAARLVQCDGSTLRTVPLSGGVKTFSSSGSWVQPPGVVPHVRAVAAGASGGAGARKGTGVAADGGPAGAGGETLEAMIHGISAGTSITVTIPSGPSGAVGASSDNTDAVVGTDGGDASFGAYLVAIGGKANAVQAGSVLTTATSRSNPGGVPHSDISTVCAGRMFQDRSGSGGTLNDGAGGGGGNGKDGTSARKGMRSLRGGGGGGGGGSINASNVGTAGGDGGASGASAAALTTRDGSGPTGGAVATNGSSTSVPRNDSPAGDGGSGGGAGVSAAAGNGAAGTVPGGGGGGGGASRNTFASGSGGSGGRGEITVTEII